jgi:hypothetical protein
MYQLTQKVVQRNEGSDFAAANKKGIHAHFVDECGGGRSTPMQWLLSFLLLSSLLISSTVSVA